jgi:hypothetical protein
MTDHHFEPYVHLVDVTHKAALIAWGGFWFRVPPGGGPEDAVVVDDEDLGEVSPRRDETIGARSKPYGEAVVEALDARGEVAARAATDRANHVWLTGLEPDTRYRFRLLVNGKPWEADVHHDWAAGPDGRMGLRRSDRRYRWELRTHPDPATSAGLTFAALGDFGIGIKRPTNGARRQRTIALALERAMETHDLRLVLTTGDNIYLSDREAKGGSGDEDDDWFFTFYQPYRYVIDHIPVYPSAGNHDAAQEASDDRQQLADNFFLEQRFAGEVDGRAASLKPGLFYRFGYGADIEFVCIDTTQASAHGERFFDDPQHAAFLDKAFPRVRSAGSHPRWRIVFSHHPAYCAGPKHHGTTEMVERLVPLFERSGVRLVLSGHEHNFQHAVVQGIHYLITGAGGKLSTTPPSWFDEANTRTWAAREHFIVIEVDARRMEIRPYGGLGPNGEPTELVLLDRSAAQASGPIVIEPGSHQS